MKIQFLNPPFLKRYSRSQRSPAVTRSGTLYYPIWLASAAAVLDGAGFEIDLVDAPAAGLGLQESIRRAEAFDPALTVIDTSTPSIYSDVAVAGRIKEALPRTTVALVGTHVSALPEETLRLDRRVDAVSRREYEYSLLELARALRDNRDWESVTGLSFRKGERIVHNPDRPLPDNLDALPFVSPIYRRFLNLRHYFNPNALYPMVTILSGRGCPFGCSFCVYPQTFSGRKYRLRSPQNVVEEMEYIKQNFPGVRAIFFEDDTLTADRERCRELMELIRERGIDLSLTANARADVDRDTLSAMKAAGLRLLCVGFEAGQQSLLEDMRKGITVDQARRFMRNCRDLDILVHGCFIFGNPGETRTSMETTLRFARELDPDTAQFYPMMVYPGTAAYRWAKENGYLVTEDYSRWLSPTGQHECVVSTPEVSNRESVEFSRRARREFYLRFSYLFGKFIQTVRHPGEARRILKAAKTFSRHLARDLTS